MINNKLVGQAIAAMRQDAGMTQQALASCLNVSHQAVSKWENGSALPDVLTLLEISKLFGVTMEQLLSGETPSRMEKEVPIREKPIELKLDLNPLSQRVQDALSEADEALKEAESANEDTSTPADNAAETSEDGAPTAAYEADDGIDIDKIISMAPFMSRKAIDSMALRYKGKCDARQLSRLAPFVSSDTLEKLIMNNEGEINWDTLRRLAPFLKREAVDAMTMAVAKGEKYFRPAAHALKKSAKDIEKSAKGIGHSISHGFDKAMRHLDNLGDRINREIEKSFQPKKDEPIAKNVNPVSSARSRIFQRALNEEKFDWIAEHMDQLDDQELKTRILNRARELGMNDWIAENMDDYCDQDTIDGAILSGNWDYISEHLDSIDDDTCEVIISTALAEGRWEWLDEFVDEISLTDASVLAIVKSAVSENKWDWLSDHISDISPDGEASDAIINAVVAASRWDWLSANMGDIDMDDRAAEIAEKAYAAGHRDIALELIDEYSDSANMISLLRAAIDSGDSSFIEEIMEHVDTETAGALCISLAEEGRMADAVSIAENADDEIIARLLDMASETGDWELIDKINDLL